MPPCSAFPADSRQARSRRAGRVLPPVSRRSSPTPWRSPGALAPVTGRIDSDLHQHAEAGPRVKVLRTLPGVGEFTALVMVAEVGDFSRFPVPVSWLPG